ncbi:MAG: hypothetical protein F6K28_61820, partial [Microcoleus sp. SIO2G3]|nr:hypothetical protein [Microcoleus sp. SIO2G3]
MDAKNFAMLMIFVVAIPTTTVVEAVPSQVCPIAKSIYRDGDGKGFQLVFGSPPPNTPYSATAVINHSQSGQIYHFTVSQSSGYGSVWLIDQSRTNSSQRNMLWITFFDQDLKSATPLWLGEEKEAPKYAVI